MEEELAEKISNEYDIPYETALDIVRDVVDLFELKVDNPETNIAKLDMNPFKGA